MTNNFDEIYNLLDFKESGDFYFLQLFKRRKDNPGQEKDVDIVKNYCIYSKEDFLKYKNEIISLCESNNARAYFRINIRNERKIALHTLSNLINALILNQHPNNSEILELKEKCFDNSFDLIKVDRNLINDENSIFKQYVENLIINASALITNSIRVNQSFIKKIFLSDIGSYNSDKNKKWIIDLDIEIIECETLIIDAIVTLHSLIKNKESKIYAIIPTVTGKHIITSPFDLKRFSDRMKDLNIWNENLIQKDSPTLLYYNKI